MYTAGYPKNRTRSFSTYEDMWNSWRTACLLGTVPGRLSPHSIVPIVVSDAELQKRLDRWRAEQRPQAARAEAEVAAAAAGTGPPPNTAPIPPPPCSPPGSFGPSTSAPRASPGGRRSPVVVPDDDDERPPPVDKGKGPARDDDEELDPPAWVVIRGVRPGVHYFRFVGSPRALYTPSLIHRIVATRTWLRAVTTFRPGASLLVACALLTNCSLTTSRTSSSFLTEYCLCPRVPLSASLRTSSARCQLRLLFVV